MTHEEKVIIKGEKPKRERPITQQIIPEAVLSPTEVTRKGAKDILQAVFDSTQETTTPGTDTNVNTGTVESTLEFQNASTSEFNSAQLREWARYFNDFPVSLQTPLASTEDLIRYLDYSLMKTKLLALKEKTGIFTKGLANDGIRPKCVSLPANFSPYTAGRRSLMTFRSPTFKSNSSALSLLSE